MMQIAVVSDTHGPRFWKRCPPALVPHLSAADLILHAGDVCVPSVLDELSEFAPVRVVRGNNDSDDITSWGAPDRLELALEGVPVGMIHDSGQKTGRLARMRREFPESRCVVFGHSHIPLVERDVDGFVIFNPGSPTNKRRQPRATFGWLAIDNGSIVRADIIEL